MSDENKVVLTSEQIKYVLEHCGEPNMTLNQLTQDTFNDKTVSARTPHGRAVKECLATNGAAPVRGNRHDPVPPVELTDEQKKQIEELGPRIDSTVELATLVWGRPVKNLSREWRAVFKHKATVFPEGVNVSEEPVDDQQWEPPSTIQTLCTLVNRYVTSGNARPVYKWGSLKISEERSLNALMSYLRVFGLKYQASQYERNVDRELFLSTFIRWSHDKPDLTQIEVDQMILAAAWKVKIADIERLIRRTEKLQEAKIDGNVTDESGKKQYFNMADVELINQIHTKHEHAQRTVASIMETLEASRSKRRDEKAARGSSILNLIEAWQNDPHWRESIIAVGEEEKADDKREVEKLKTAEDILALISGQTEEEGAM